MANQIKNNVLLIDIGNSSLKWAITGSNGLSDMSQQLYPKDISGTFFINCWRDLEQPDEVVVSCVAQDAVWQALEKACDDLWNIKVQKVNSAKEEFGLINAYEKVSSLGSDRWCAMLGGLHQSTSAFIVINAGSAITVDVVNKSGQHLGGYIVPGINMMKKSLGLHTAQVQIEEIRDVLPALSLGRSTEDCVEAGIHLSIGKFIEAVFEKESKQMNECQAFVSGGDAKVISDLLPFKCVIIPELVLRGLAVIAANELK